MAEATVAYPGRAARRRGGRGAVVAVLLAVAVGNGAAVVWLWYHGGGVTGVHSSAELWESLGRITGLLSGYLALLEVLLLARLPWLERLAGFDRLTVWHRWNGHAVVWLAVAHTVLITVGYAGVDHRGAWAEFEHLFKAKYPGMVTATVGTALLVAVVLTSLVVVRRKLPYEWWYAIHLMAYAGIALAWFHQIPTGNEFAEKAAPSDYWKSLYGAALALLVAGRVLQPLWGYARHGLRVAEVVAEGPGVVSLRFTGRNLDRLRVRAGQFFLWRFLARGRWWEAHPFSLSEAPDGGSLRITIKASGDHTRKLLGVKPGTRVLTEGPFGTFTDAARRRGKSLLIAGGIGITPIRALLEELGGEVELIYRVLADDDVVFRAELDELGRRRGFAPLYVVGDHATPEGTRILDADHLRELVPDVADRDVFVCGPPAMTNAIVKTVRSVGVPRRLIHAERFAY